MITRVQFQTEMRAAAVQMLEDFKVAQDLPLQVYRAQPRSIKPPTAFIDRVGESIVFDGLRQRTVRVEIKFVWGLFDSGEAVDQRDPTIDAFIDWLTDNYHAAGGRTVLEPREITDDPVFVPEWMDAERQFTYFASTLVMEGFTGGY